ncbi:MAG: endonuclease/exonuclease/phosphatase family protein [Thermoleophilia bacterium]|nr:endonuclease/exonuclease/phosphatase family protein [Thermoleophilia bacterium]
MAGTTLRADGTGLGLHAPAIAIGAPGLVATGTGLWLARSAPRRALGVLLAIGGAAAMGAALLVDRHRAAAHSDSTTADQPNPDPAAPAPTEAPTRPAADEPRPSVRIAQLNAHNFFDTTDGYGSDTILTPQQYEIKLGKLGLAIRDAMHAPDVIAMQEVENIGVLQDLAARPELARYGYRPLLVDGTDPRGIDVGYLYRPDRVELVSSEARGTTRVSASGRNVQLFTRPPLVATFRVRSDGAAGADDARAGASFTLINNHFTSKLQGSDGEEKRRLQSAWVSHLASGDAGVADLDPARVIVLGDLNAGLDEDAYLSLLGDDPEAAPRFVNAAEHVPLEDRYSYRDGSRRSLLDHVLLTPALDAAVQGVEILHINSDPSPRLEDDPTTYQRVSDHDPVIVTLQP